MRPYLGTGERVFITIGKYQRRNARIKEVQRDGSVLLSFSTPTALQAGTAVVMELVTDSHVLSYYMRLISFQPPNQPVIRLHRFPVSNQNRKRTSWRVPFSLQTGIRTQKTPHFLGAQFCDLSVSGARLISEVHFPTGAKVEIRLPIPEAKEAIVGATIRRSSSTPVGQNPFGQELYEMGLVFEKLPSKTYSDLVHYMWKSVRKHYGEQLRQTYMANSRSARSQSIDFVDFEIPIPGKEEFWKPRF